MKKWVEIMMPVMLFATVLYFCVFAVLTHRSTQTAAMQPGGTTVVLDAGHGGEDGGATGVSGTSEAALNLDISLRLRDLLRLCGVRVSMIRETDTAVYSDGCRTISEKKVSDIKNRTETVNHLLQRGNLFIADMHHPAKPLGFQNGCCCQFHDLKPVKRLQQRFSGHDHTVIFHDRCRMRGIKFLCQLVWIQVKFFIRHPLDIAQENIAFRDRSCIKFHVRNGKRHCMDWMS